jgi:PAS domain S-box-containing protein
MALKLAGPLGSRPARLRYSVAVAAAFVAVLLRFALGPSAGQAFPYVAFFAMVILSAWYGGFGPGLVTIALDAVLAFYFFFPRTSSAQIDDWRGLVRFILGSLIITTLIRALYRVRLRNEENRSLAAKRLVEIQAHQEWAAVTLASIGDAVLTTDTESRIAFMNPVAAALTGWTAGAAAGQDIRAVFRIFDERTDTPVENPLERVLREGIVAGLANHAVLETRDGVRIPIDDSAAPIKDPDGRIAGAVLIFRDITERRSIERRRKEAEEQLARSQEEFRNLVESISDGFVALDREWRYTYVNAEAARQARMSREDMIGHCLWDLFPRTVGTELYRELHRSVAEQTPVTCEAGYPPQTLRIRAYPSAEGISLYVVDISAEKEAAAVTARLASIVESSGDAIISKNLDGIVTTWNKGAERIFGYTEAEMTGQPIAKLAPPDRVGEITKILERIRCGERVETLETVRLTKGGRLVDISLTVSPIYDAGGRIVGASKIARDITEHKTADRALRNSEARLGMALDVGAMGVWEWDIPERKMTWSPQLEAIHGLQPGSFAGTLEDVDSDMHPGDRGRVRQEIRRAFDTRTDYKAEYRIILPNGNVAWLEARGRVLLDGAGEPSKMVGVCMNITTRKRAEEELLLQADRLARSNADLQSFAYAASHDLQEPLRNISTFAELLGRRYKGRLDPEADEIISLMADSAVRMGGLIEDLLGYARLISAENPPFTDVPLNEAVRWALRNLQTAIAQSGARVEAGALPAIRGDKLQLSQLFQNLIGNAIKYRGPEPPLIRVAAEQSGGEWVFSVSDNGVGIDPAYHDKIFGIFRRLHGSEYPGTGIGLAICKRIVEKHGGRIWVQSDAGKGATFRFSMRVDRPNVT